MFFVVTKGRLLILLAALVCITGLVVVARSTLMTAAPVPVNPKLILIDAGHGGEDGGGVGVAGTLEKDLNLAIALKLKQLFAEGGYEVRMIRETDTDISDPGKKTVKARKNSDLHNRKAVIAESGCAAFVSVHMNKFTDPSVAGAQVFHATTNEQSPLLAEAVRLSLINTVGDRAKRIIKPIPASVQLLKNVSCPAIIVECGFLSNAAEEQELQDPAHQDKIAQGIYEGVCNFLVE